MCEYHSSVGTLGHWVNKRVFCIVIENIGNWVHTHVLIKCKTLCIDALLYRKKKNEKNKRTKEKEKQYGKEKKYRKGKKKIRKRKK